MAVIWIFFLDGFISPAAEFTNSGNRESIQNSKPVGIELSGGRTGWSWHRLADRKWLPGQPHKLFVGD